MERIQNRIPRFFRPYTAPLLHAPGTHITSFLILHELTAIIPLIILGVSFHYSGWLPKFVREEKVAQYQELFGRYFGRKRWFGVEAPLSIPEGDQTEGISKTSTAERIEALVEGGLPIRSDGLKEGEGEEVNRYGDGTRIVLEVATAYAITKAMLPGRVIGSVWATPWFARTVLGAFRRFRR